MLEEHAEGRALVRAMGEGAPAGQAASARRCVELLRQHIEKENGVLFLLADAVLDEAHQRQVGRDFAGVEAALGCDDTLAAAELKLDHLAQALVS